MKAIKVKTWVGDGEDANEPDRAIRLTSFEDVFGSAGL
jgi:hypothetical protein